MIAFLAHRLLDGTVIGLLRVVDGQAEQWSKDQGWVPAGSEWTGIGGATDYDPVSVEEAILILIEFGAEDLNPVPH
jgi:hypothetical protein